MADGCLRVDSAFHFQCKRSISYDQIWDAYWIWEIHLLILYYVYSELESLYAIMLEDKF